MNKEVAKKAFEAAEKELEDKQIEKLKNVVKDTLRKIQDLDKEIVKLEEERKILKLDIDDLKAGRLDKIEERQKVDSKAKQVSVIIVEKEVHHYHGSPWYQPYIIHYVPYYPPVHHFPITYGNCNNSQSAFFGSNAMVGLAIDTDMSAHVTTTTNSDSVFMLNASTAKNYTGGTYNLGTKIVNL